MEDLLGHEVDMREVEERIVERFAEVFEMTVADLSLKTVGITS